jgi:hypothetical protein
LYRVLIPIREIQSSAFRHHLPNGLSIKVGYAYADLANTEVQRYRSGRDPTSIAQQTDIGSQDVRKIPKLSADSKVAKPSGRVDCGRCIGVLPNFPTKDATFPILYPLECSGKLSGRCGFHHRMGLAKGNYRERTRTTREAQS